MKLVIITAISEFTKDIKKILKISGIKTFTLKEVTGYKNISDDQIESNWFGSEMNETESVMFYAFTENENINKVFREIESFNSLQDFHSEIHVATLNIDRINN